MIWRILPFRSDSAFKNMAIDEAVFRQTVKNRQLPVLRFFSWRRPAVSVGYFQDIKNGINYQRCLRDGVDIVRRITGGKAVYHCDEITYSLSVADSEGLFPNDIIRTYEIISLCLARGLSYLGIEAYLAKSSDRGKKKSASSSSCFSVPSGKELMVAGRKICGSAQTRTHGGFLQHGSLLLTFDPKTTVDLIGGLPSDQSPDNIPLHVAAVNQLLPVPVNMETLAAALQKGFTEQLGMRFSEESLSSDEKALAEDLVKKYESESWTWERKKEGFDE